MLITVQILGLNQGAEGFFILAGPTCLALFRPNPQLLTSPRLAILHFLDLILSLYITLE